MNYDVILNANDSTTLETQYAFTQGDYGQIQFSIRVKADGQYISNATRAYIVFSLSNGMIVTGADMQKSVATYTYVFQGNELQSPGKVVADVKLVYANGQISSNKFTFICRYDPLADKSVPAAPYITVLQRIVDEGQEKIDYLQALIDSIQGSIGGTPLTRDDLQNTRSPVSAGIKALDAHMAQYMLLKEDIVNQFLNDPNRPASAALAYTLNSNLTDIGTAITTNITAYVDTMPNGTFRRCYYLSTTSTDAPSASNGFVDIYKISSSWAVIIATAISDGMVYSRSKNNGTWRAWTKIANRQRETGFISSINCAAQSIAEQSITFSGTFSAAPNVQVTINSGTTNSQYGNLLTMVVNVTTTGFTLRIANASTSALTPGVYWSAEE